jgi:hypothetical protein
MFQAMYNYATAKGYAGTQQVADSPLARQSPQKPRRVFQVAAVNTLLGLILVLSSAAAFQVPDFGQFPAEHADVAKPLVLSFSSGFQRQFRTRISEAAKLRPNFADHYRLADWGCGSQCVSIALVDLATGRVYDGPFRTLGYGRPQVYVGGESELEYRISSRLLITRGCPEDKDCGTYYFVWEGSRFRPVLEIPTRPTER